jgi:hypothetical protein
MGALRWLDHPRARLVIVAAGVALALPSLVVGFFADDWYMLATLRKQWAEAPAWWNLYDFVPDSDAGIAGVVHRGALPWWTAPSLRLHLVRPLSSALLALDERLFGDAPVGWHVHSLVWWAVLLALVAAFFRRIARGAAPTGTLALLVFCLAPCGEYAYGWPSARHLVVGAAPALAGLLAHLAFRQDGWKPGRWLAPLGVAVGLAGSEAALGVLGFWFTYEVFGRASTGGARTAAERLRGPAVPVLLGVVYLVVYKVVGHGGSVGGDAYVTPLPHPVDFAIVVARRVPLLLANAILGLPAEFSVAAPRWVFITLGIGAAGLVGSLLSRTRDLATDDERAALAWLVPGAIVAMIGTSGGLAGARQLLVPNLGVAFVLAFLMRRGWERGGYARVAGGFFVLMHVVLAPLASLAQTAAMTTMGDQGVKIAAALPDEVRPAKRVFILVGSDPMASLYVVLTLLGLGNHDFDCVVRLTGTAADYRVTRTGSDTLRIEPLGHALLRTTFETLYRARALAFRAGDEIPVCGARVRVAEVDDGSPTRLDVSFGAPLDDPSLATVVWDGSRLARVGLAEGEARVFPWRPGPMHNQ